MSTWGEVVPTGWRLRRWMAVWAGRRATVTSLERLLRPNRPHSAAWAWRRATVALLLFPIVAGVALGASPPPRTVAASSVTIDQVPHLPGAPPCRPSDADPHQPTSGRTKPPPAPDYFPSDFPRFTDSLWGNPIGGFGGLRWRAPLHHTPVVFVHGNQADAQNWLDVMLQFQNDAGYTMQEMYAISYNGLENYYAGLPVQHAPTTLDAAYLAASPQAAANGGHGSANDDEVPNLCRFVEAVQWYTGSPQVDIVAHSLGVTIARKFMAEYPSLAADVVAFVGIAGANHGTSVCRGLETSYYGCNEIAPGSPWLENLNGPGGRRETYAPTAWMTVFDGTGLADPYYNGTDASSPRLGGAENVTFPGQYHNDLRVGPEEVDVYLPFLLRYGQAGPGASPTATVDAERIAAEKPDGTKGPTLCGVPALTGPVAGCPPLPDQGVVGSPSDAGGPAGPGRSGVGSAATVLPGTAPPSPPVVLADALALAAVGGVALLGSRRRRRRR